MTDFFKILGVRISAVNLKTACDQMEEWIAARTLTYVCVAPVATVMDCQNDDEYRNVINNAGMVTPDGMPIVWLGQRRAGKMVQRTYGPDLMKAFCKVSESRGYKHFFYGGSSVANRLLVENLKEKFPALSVVGQYAPSFLVSKQKEKPEIINQINDSDADVLWVGLGSPKQDFWMMAHRKDLRVPVLVGAGAAFDFIAGTKAQAPVWMQKTGLEWMFRLCCEPQRLWRRYLLGNARFIYLLFTKEIFAHEK